LAAQWKEGVNMKNVVNPIYQPTGRAREYCDWALNIYDSCNHGCTYCWAKRFYERYHPGKKFGVDVQPRPGIVEATRKQLQSGKFSGKTIQLCFTCDPYPAEIDTTTTREIIKAIKEAGAHVQILTKGGDRAERDFDLLDKDDWFGISLSCNDIDLMKLNEPNAQNGIMRYFSLENAYELGINTWVSFEPVLEPYGILEFIKCIGIKLPKTYFKIGKLNHVKNSTDWKSFGLVAERICKENGWNYYIKADLLQEMER
jgi:DNA repair photolyase